MLPCNPYFVSVSLANSASESSAILSHLLVITPKELDRFTELST